MDRIAHRLRPAPFASVRRDAQPGLARGVKRPQEIFGRTDFLIASNTKANDEIPRRFCRTARRLTRLFGAEMANAGDDAPQSDAHGGLCLIGGLTDGMQIFAPRANVAATTKIWRQERFRVNHAACSTFFQHGQRQAIEIFGALQSFGSGLINFEEIPEIGEFIAALFIEDARKINLFLFRQTPDKRRRCAALQMKVQFNFWQRIDYHRKFFPNPWPGIPKCAATDAATSTKVQFPISPTPAPAHRTGTRSRVCSVPRQVGSLP